MARRERQRVSRRHAAAIRRQRGMLVRNVRAGRVPAGQSVRVAGFVTRYQERPRKPPPGRLAMFTLDDGCRAIEVVVFSRQWARSRHVLREAGPILVQGRLTHEGTKRWADTRLMLTRALRVRSPAAPSRPA